MSKVDRSVIGGWIIEALERLGHSAHYKRVAKEIWLNHGDEIKSAGDVFYIWQYEMRWAAQSLKKRGVLENSSNNKELPKGAWGLSENYNAH